MAAADPHRVERVFAAATRFGGDVRSRFVALCCRDDAALRAEVDSLLAAHDEATRDDAFLRNRAAPPPRIESALHGRYRVVEVMGSGGMGTVFRAEQLEPVRRPVALKLLRRELGTPEARARFAAEQQAVALMDHENVARLFDSGTLDEIGEEGAGRPYFSMELVEGVALNAWCEAVDLPLRERVALLVPVCRAVHHAHQKGVIHRDLKPSNVLVTLKDGRPVPKVIDFGVAKAAAARDAPFPTEHGELLGTLEYMSPEQAGSAGDVDTRADLYSLGVMLYELVAGVLPFDPVELRARGLAEALRTLREVEPMPPSVRITPLRRAHSSPADLAELDWIVAKAIEKERAGRYASAAALGDDLDRFLAHEPLTVGPPTARYRLGKLLRRHRGAFAAALAIVASLAAGLAAATWKSIEAGRERDGAVKARKLAEANLYEALSIVGTSTTLTGELLANVAGGTRSRLRLAEAMLTAAMRLGALDDAPRSRYLLGYAHQRLGEARLVSGASGAALDCFQRALAVREQAVAAEPTPQNVRALGVSHWKIGEALAVLGRFEEALRHDRLSLDLHRKSSGFDEKPVLMTAIYLGISLRRIADDERELGRLDEARAHGHEALSALAAGFPQERENVQLRLTNAITLRVLGESSFAAGEPALAEEQLRAAVEQLVEDERRADPANVFERKYLARARVALADVLAASDRADEAIAQAQEAAALSRAMADADPMLDEARHGLGQALVSLAGAQSRRGLADEAAASRQEAIARLEELAKRDPGNALVARDLAAARAPR